MVRRLAALAVPALLIAVAASAQQPLPPLPPAAPAAPDAGVPAEPGGAQPGRVFCQQTVTFHLADPATVPERFRGFLGIWSDAAWDARTCAALIVENVQPDGTAAIRYIYGPMDSNGRGPGGILHGTGVIRDGELKFQNSDGSQYAFRPALVDLAGTYTTPRGQTYQATFKQTP